MCLGCGEEGHRAFEFSNYNMQEMKQGQKPNLNLVQDENEEEGFEYEVLPDMGESLMIQRSMVILEKEQMKSSGNEDSWLRNKYFSNQMYLWGKGMSSYY